MINPRRAAKRKQRLESEWIWNLRHVDSLGSSLEEL